MTAKEDHPRGCGENDIYVGCKIVNIGSPPRMRGKHEIDHSGNREYGITPADAGKTHDILLSISPAKDHPRGCGENRRSQCVFPT